nr:hypothetical protein Iba_chr07cCG6470 [Ipomoea batatas]
MDTSTPVNMGVVCKRWLKAQQSKKVITLFVGPLVTQLCLSLGYQTRMEESNKVLGSAAMTPLSMTNLSELKIGRNLRMRTGAKAIKRRLPKKPKKRVDPSHPFPFLEPPKPSTPRKQTPTPSDSQHLSSPTLSLNISISNDAPPSDNPNAIPSPSSPAAPACFTKVTNWESMQRFQYELHMEHENLLEQRDLRTLNVALLRRTPNDDQTSTEWLEVGVASTGVLHPLEVLDRIDSLTLPFANHFMEFQHYVMYFLFPDDHLMVRCDYLTIRPNFQMMSSTSTSSSVSRLFTAITSVSFAPVSSIVRAESSSSNWIGSNLGTSSVGKATGTSTTNSSAGSLVRWVTRTSTGAFFEAFLKSFGGAFLVIALGVFEVEPFFAAGAYGALFGRGRDLNSHCNSLSFVIIWRLGLHVEVDSVYKRTFTKELCERTDCSEPLLEMLESEEIAIDGVFEKA